ncbi:MAG: TrkH family potassium uptake protein [Alphaproteobacteria bacterium]
MKYQPIFFVIGMLLLALGCLMLIPMALDWAYDDPAWEGFAEAAALTIFTGTLVFFANRPHGQMELSLRETFILTTSTWMVLAAFASLPFIFTNITTSNTDSIFEAVSALSTTGASVISGLDFASYGLLIWRAILQWTGGIGIIVMAMTVMPILHIGGMQLFRSEFSDKMEKILPRVSQITKAIFWTYLLLTILCIFALKMCGMNYMDAICHGLTTVSTGGMSTYDNSIGAFNMVSVEWVMIVFMILGSIPLLHVVRFLRGDRQAFWQDGQVRTFLTIALMAPITVTFFRYISGDESFLHTARESIFNTVCILTTSGFSSADYSSWGAFTIVLFFMLFLVGGCTGSTTSGLKIFRAKIMYSLMRAQFFKLYRPHTIHVPTFNKQPISPEVFSSVFLFLGLYVSCFAGLSLGLALFELDFMTAVSGAAAMITNLGPGFGDVIGPTGDYSTIPTGAKWLMMMGMIVGRLEMITVLVLLTPSFWRV